MQPTKEWSDTTAQRGNQTDQNAHCAAGRGPREK